MQVLIDESLKEWIGSWSIARDTQSDKGHDAALAEPSGPESRAPAGSIEAQREDILTGSQPSTEHAVGTFNISSIF